MGIKQFKEKPVIISAGQFDGSRDSAKALVVWIKEPLGDNYVGSDIRERVEGRLIANGNTSFLDTGRVLIITTKTSNYALSNGDWLLYDEVKGLRIMTDEAFTTKYDAI